MQLSLELHGFPRSGLGYQEPSLTGAGRVPNRTNRSPHECCKGVGGTTILLNKCMNKKRSEMRDTGRPVAVLFAGSWAISCEVIEPNRVAKPMILGIVAG